MKVAVGLSLLPLALAGPAPQGATIAAVKTPPNAQVIPGQYIVKLKDSSNAATVGSVADTIPPDPKHVYTNTQFKGFSVKANATELQKLQANPNVDYIEKDSIAGINGFVTQSSSTWGLARISHFATGQSNYVYDSSAGEGTCAYVIDTGVDDTHPDFGGRAKELISFATTSTDDNGHGTHVAGTIGSNTYGVAKKTTIYGVKVLEASGSAPWSQIIAGINWVASDFKQRNCPKGTVANLSIQGGKTDSVNAAVAALLKAGVFVGVCAGNYNTDAATYSPASETTTCTVGASDINDQRADFSNWGSVVDIWGPGVDVLSLAPGGGTAFMSGTSMATPHVVGLAAYTLAINKTSPVAMCPRLATAAYTSKRMIQNTNSPYPWLAFNSNPNP